MVCAVDSEDAKLVLAKRPGADLVVNAQYPSAVETVRKGTAGGAHAVWPQH
jgi:Zn-dependent alcohol dehydrogenase